MRKLFDWRFDAYRVNERSKIVKNRGTKEIKALIDDKLLDHELEIEDNEDFLNIFIPLFNEDINQEAKEIYQLIADIVVLTSNGESVGFRESFDQTLSLISKEGYCPIVLKSLVQEYEDLLFLEYTKKKKD